MLLLVHGTATYARNFDWRDDATLFESAPPGVIQSPRTFYNRAAERWRAGRVQEAFEDYRTALRGHPRYAEAWLNLGTLLRTVGKEDEAQRCYERAVLYGRHTPVPAFVYGKYLEKRGEPVRAARLYRKALDVYAGFEPARVRLERLESPAP
ncbi:tetratricopeptide repeat protein [Elusimicrobiota bacterium]